MNLERVRSIADALLYEGYVLYPYRASALKNRHRWTLGSLYPPRWCEADGGSTTSRLTCQCLVQAGPDAAIEAKARFLQLQTTRLGQESWEEAVPHEVDAGPLSIGDLATRPHAEPFSFDGRAAGAPARRERCAVEGRITLAATPLATDVWRLTVTVENTSDDRAPSEREAQLRALASAHVVLGVTGGAFVSLLDPPEPLRALAEACENAGTWPVLAGTPGDRDLVLCSPIILYDHPAVAPESPGDFFDGTEMDEMLVLRILTLTDDERREAAALDDRTRALLARVDALGPDELGRLHGAVRAFGPAREGARTVRVGAATIGPGARVRLRPSGRSDVFDLALAGLAATVAAIEQDYEDRTYVTVTIDDDPGKDLGARGLPGHRFFFRPDEIEALGDAEERR